MTNLTLWERTGMIVNTAIEARDITVITRYMQQMAEEARLRGLAIAKALYLTQEKWAELQEATGIEEDFFSFTYSEMGLRPSTVRKYVRLYGCLFKSDAIPEEVKQGLLSMPVASLLLLPASADEGGLDDKWDEVIQAHDPQSVREVVKTSKSSAKNRIYIRLTEDGSLTTKKGDDGEWVSFGYINRDKESHPVASIAIERIINKAGILR